MLLVLECTGVVTMVTAILFFNLISVLAVFLINKATLVDTTSVKNVKNDQ